MGQLAETYHYIHCSIHHCYHSCAFECSIDISPWLGNGRPEVENARPKLKDLQLLQFFKWQGVGLELGLEDITLRMIEHNHPRDLNGAIVEMLCTWLAQDSDATFGKLSRALVAVGEECCAQQLADKKGES